MKLIKTFSGGAFLKFDQGSFDQWCVYLVRPDKPDKPLLDKDAFAVLNHFARRYGRERIYSDYKNVYELTEKELNPEVLDRITGIAASYPEHDQTRADILYTFLYAAMIAEEQKEGTHLGKRIKRLGIHQLLMEGYTPEQAAKFSYRVPWKTLAEHCMKRGF